MMKNILFILLGMLVLCHACIEDDSTLPDKPISEISISLETDSISVDFGAELVYEPKVEQTGDLPLTYEWAYQAVDKKGNKDSLKFLSNERILRHQFKKLGEYSLRLKVTNEHGSSFQRYSVYVRAFDEGIFVLSKDDNGKGRVSFMRPLSREEKEEGKEETFNTSIFSSINPDYELDDPVDVEKIGADIFLLCRGNKSYYRIDGQTFELYSAVDLGADFPELTPKCILSKDRSVDAFQIWSEEGGFIKVNYVSDILIESDLSKKRMDKMYRCIYNGSSDPSYVSITNMRSFHFFMNYEQSSVYYCFDLKTAVEAKALPKEEIINMVMLDDYVYLVTRTKANPNKINYWYAFFQPYPPKNVSSLYWWYPSYADYSYNAEQITLTRESKIQSNQRLKTAFYTNGNKIYRWVPDWWQPNNLPTQPVLTLEGKEITCFEFSPDWLQVYVGVYDPSLPDLKGSVYVYDADKIDPATKELTLVKKYEGIADRPVKVFWKNSRR